LWGKCPKGRGSLLEDVEFELDSDPNLQRGSTSAGGGGSGRGGVVRGGRANSVTAIMPDEKVHEEIMFYCSRFVLGLFMTPSSCVS
jgi:hypothetical protein